MTGPRKVVNARPPGQVSGRMTVPPPDRRPLVDVRLEFDDGGEGQGSGWAHAWTTDLVQVLWHHEGDPTDEWLTWFPMADVRSLRHREPRPPRGELDRNLDSDADSERD